MRVIAFVMAALFLASMSRAEESAYVIVDASRPPNEAKQPKWIVLTRHGSGAKYFRVATGQALVTLQPGQYTVKQIAFNEDYRNKNGSLWFTTEARIEFDVNPDAVTYVGLIELGDSEPMLNHSPRFNVSLDHFAEHLRNACQADREVFARLPIRLVRSGVKDKLMRVRCET